MNSKSMPNINLVGIKMQDHVNVMPKIKLVGFRGKNKCSNDAMHWPPDTRQDNVRTQTIRV